MSKLSKIILYITIAILGIWHISLGLNRLLNKSVSHPFTIYSSILGDFITVDYIEGKGIRKSLAGQEFSDTDVDSLVPTLYVRQLVTDGRFPSIILGQEVTPQSIQRDNFSFRSTPRSINKPSIKLYPLLESMSKRVDLKSPTDVFRITDSEIEFVIMNTNERDDKKSKRFTDVFNKLGFKFPAKLVAGNPTIRKDYDDEPIPSFGFSSFEDEFIKPRLNM